MVIVQSLWWALQEHTVAPEAMAHRLLRRMVEHPQDRMACRETQLEARAENMRDPVTKRVEMPLIRYNPKITEMEVRKQPDWRTKAVRGRDGSGGKRGRRAQGTPDGTHTKKNQADMRAGWMNSVAARGDSWRGTGGKGAAVAPVTWTGASGTGHAESQSGTRRRPGGSGPG